jgi:2,5-dihydroxypyridine 5,6-dioxygenase
MLVEQIEAKWLAVFENILAELCHVRRGEVVAIVSESQSRAVLVQLAELALLRLGAHVYQLRMPTPPLTQTVPLRSTGASLALGGLRQVVEALASADLIVDCTVEGLLHSPERQALLASGARLFMFSNEHPEVFERLKPQALLQEKCAYGARLITEAAVMRVTSRAGTDLTVKLDGISGRGVAGAAYAPRMGGFWPAGLCACNPAAGAVSGTVVLAPGDANLTFKRYMESPVRLTIEADYITRIDGNGLDAELMRSYFAAWNDREAYATSHLGWGMNPGARWDALVMYDKGDVNCTELRAFAGNFLFSTGANEFAGRFTACHFDLPMRNCSVQLDDRYVVREGTLSEDLRI